jgi:hypothetical protein
VSILVLGAIVRVGTSQQQRFLPKPNPWLDRAVTLTNDLGDDALRLERYDRSVMWARVGGAWWKIDRERARGYFFKAVETLELDQAEEQKDISCRSVAARTVLAIVASRDRGLHSRLISLIGINNDRANDEQKSENATALADVGLSLVSDDPQSAARFGEASLHLGLSPRLARLLWTLRGRDADSADSLLREIAQAGRTGRDFNWFSLLTTAAFKGPFISEEERILVLRALADSVAHDNPAANGPACQLTSFIPPLLSYYEKLLPQEVDRLGIFLTQCQNRLSNDSAGSKESSEPQAPDTVDSLLAAAGKSRRGEDRDDYLLKAARLAADQDELDRAIRILDSIDSDGRGRLKNSWSDLRWNYGSTLACSFAAKNDPVRMTEIIDQTPGSVRPFVAIFLVGTCKSLREPVQKLQLLASAPTLLNKSTTSQEAEWSMALVRRYAEIQPAETSAVLSDAIAAINRAAEEDETKNCSGNRRVSPVLNTDLILERYKLPVSLLAADEIAVRSAVNAVRPSDKRVAMRLLLLNASLAQSVNDQPKATASIPK